MTTTRPLIVRTGPQEYECASGVLDTLPDRLASRSIRKILLVHGEASWEKAQPFLGKLLTDRNLIIIEEQYRGENTYKEVSRISELAEKANADAIIGVGGGKLVDTVKYAASIGHFDAIVIPTLASNCAPWTPISVMYTDEGICKGFDVMSRQTSLVLVEPAIIIDSPIEYFSAGIADTLAKWYESDPILSLPENQSKTALLMARSAALSCRTVILENARQAVEDMKSGNITAAFVQLVETIIFTAGLVGGFGDDYARTTGAHSVHDAITIFPQTHSFLHGEKVAYGVLVQLALEENWQEIHQLLGFYDSLGLPASLADLDLGQLSEAEIEQTAGETVTQDKTIHALPYETTQSIVLTAILDLEKYVESERKKLFPASPAPAEKA